MESHATTRPSVLRVGDELPRLDLLDEQGQIVDLRAVSRDSTVILFFYPRDNGIRCRTQACGIRDSWPLLRSEGIEVFGVNHGSAESHLRFKDRYGLPFPLLVDRDLHLARAFGFVNSWMPPGVSPLTRSTVIIDPGGTIRVIIPKVKPASHFDILRANLGLRERVDAPPASAEPVEAPVEVPVEAPVEAPVANAPSDEPTDRTV
ncbi:MAG: bcp [Thermoleophilia bacterium]|nr:bcp [Thermoleophilia bacterium]